MNKLLSVLLLSVTSVFASEYYAKLEPIDSYKIKAAVSGKVKFVNDKYEGKIAPDNTILVKIDKKLNEIDLKSNEAKLKITEQIIDIEKANYKKLLKISTKSDFEKDTQKVKVLNLESQKNDLVTAVETLKDTISNKTLKESGMYVDNIYIKKGDYVSPGTALYDISDLSYGKLEFYIPINKADEIKRKELYLDGKKEGKIEKIYKVADTTHISSYKVKVIVKNPSTFSKLVKIELK